MFKKGSVPWNKGKKGVNGKQKGVSHKKGYHWKMSDEGKENIREASLKRDNKNHKGWPIWKVNPDFKPNHKYFTEEERQKGMFEAYQRYNLKHPNRRAKYGFIPLNKWFEGSQGHHIDMNRVVFIPTLIHKHFAPHSPGKRSEGIETKLEAKNLDILNSVAYAELYYYNLRFVQT
jgi:hypothetical protein